MVNCQPIADVGFDGDEFPGTLCIGLLLEHDRCPISPKGAICFSRGRKPAEKVKPTGRAAERRQEIGAWQSLFGGIGVQTSTPQSGEAGRNNLAQHGTAGGVLGGR